MPVVNRGVRSERNWFSKQTFQRRSNSIIWAIFFFLIGNLFSPFDSSTEVRISCEIRRHLDFLKERVLSLHINKESGREACTCLHISGRSDWSSDSEQVTENKHQINPEAVLHLWEDILMHWKTSLIGVPREAFPMPLTFSDAIKRTKGRAYRNQRSQTLVFVQHCLLICVREQQERSLHAVCIAGMRSQEKQTLLICFENDSLIQDALLLMKQPHGARAAQ